MEGKKFRVIMGVDENGKPARRFVPYEEGQAAPVYAVYGDYLKVDKEHIQQAKVTLLEDLFDTIRKISENEDFWIVKELDENTATVGWKIHIPQMDKQ